MTAGAGYVERKRWVTLGLQAELPERAPLRIDHKSHFVCPASSLGGIRKA